MKLSYFTMPLHPITRDYSTTLAEDRAAIRFLVDHEIVAKAFCESELNGNAAHSTEPVEALIASAPGLLAVS